MPFLSSSFVDNPLIVQQIIDKVIGQGGTEPCLYCIYDFLLVLFENILTALELICLLKPLIALISLSVRVIDHYFVYL